MSWRILGYEYTWWRGDPLPGLSRLAGLRVEHTPDPDLLARINNLDRSTACARIQAGNHPFVAFLRDTPVAYGWAATQVAGIEELGLAWSFTADNRHLWDFATLEAWRGQGIYPRLLQAIVCAEDAQRFWIGHVVDNAASRRGILKAGFQLVGGIGMTTEGDLTWFVQGNCDRARADPLRQCFASIQMVDEKMTLRES